MKIAFKREEIMKKLVFLGVFCFLVAGIAPAFAYQIDGNLDDWGVDLGSWNFTLK